MYIDYNALVISQKALVVISIVLICLTNVILIVKQVRKRLFYQSPKLMTVIALAAGDILCALFPLVLEAKAFFSSTSNTIRCGVFILYVTYEGFLLHFVYGVGLIVLMLEAVYRHKLLPNVSATLRAVIFSSTPWFLGLIVVLPLCMSRVDYSTRCVNSQPIEAMYGVAVLFPACLVAVIAVAVNWAKLPAPHQRQDLVFGQQPITRDHQPNIASPIVDNYALAPIPTQSSQQQSQPSTNQYGANQYSTSQYSISHQGVPQVNAPANQASTQNTRAELKKLVIITALFFIMVVPQPSLVLAIGDKTWHYLDAVTVISQIFYWLMVARSYTTPVLMISYADL